MSGEWHCLGGTVRIWLARDLIAGLVHEFDWSKRSRRDLTAQGLASISNLKYNSANGAS